MQSDEICAGKRAAKAFAENYLSLYEIRVDFQKLPAGMGRLHIAFCVGKEQVPVKNQL